MLYMDVYGMYMVCIWYVCVRAFCLAHLLAIYIACFGAPYLAYIWRMFWHSSLHVSINDQYIVNRPTINVRSKKTQKHWTQLNPRWANIAPRWANIALRWANIAPRWANIAPRWAHIALKMGQHSPKLGQHSPKIRRRPSKYPAFYSVFLLFPIFWIFWLHMGQHEPT